MQEDRGFEALLQLFPGTCHSQFSLGEMAHNAETGHTQVSTLCIRLESISVGKKGGGLRAALDRSCERLCC